MVLAYTLCDATRQEPRLSNIADTSGGRQLVRMACTRSPFIWFKDIQGLRHFDPSWFRKSLKDPCFVLCFGRILQDLLFHLEGWVKGFLGGEGS